MATNTTTATTNLISQTNLFYTEFNESRDIVSNPNKNYYEEIVPANVQVSLGLSTSSNYIYTASYSGSTIMTAYTTSKDSYSYGAIQSLLRTYSSDMSTDWYPISSSGFAPAAHSLSVLSFANNVIGDKLNIYSTEQGRFQIIYNSETLSVQPASDFSGFTYYLNNEYITSNTNFGFVFTSSTDTTFNTDNFKGLFFGQLGLLMLYGEDAHSEPQAVTYSNAVYQETVHSKTYFCRITNEKYNASSNPTWVTYSSVLGTNVIRSVNEDQQSYTLITTIGLYNENNTLLAIAKLSQPILKYIDTELHARVVLQY